MGIGTFSLDLLLIIFVIGQIQYVLTIARVTARFCRFVYEIPVYRERKENRANWVILM
jgi:hypothetical protein